MSSTDYITTMFEQIRDQQLATLELVGATLRKVNELPTRNEFNELKQKVDVIERAVSDTNVQVKDHEHQISNLKTHPANP